MATTDRVVRDDRVLPFTRGLALFIVPFLVAGFVILYLFPGAVLVRSVVLWTRHERPRRRSDDEVRPAAAA
jgi:hypothetical protein